MKRSNTKAGTVPGAMIPSNHSYGNLNNDQAIDETSYLLGSRNNEKRLLKGIEDYEKGLARQRTLLQEE